MKYSLLLELTRRDFTERYAGSALGAIWAFLWPLVNIGIYVVIFSKVMGAKLPGQSITYSYSIYLVAGLVPWIAFSNTVSRSTTVFVDNKNILSKIAIPFIFLPLSVALSESITFLISMVFFCVFLLLTGKALHVVLFYIPVIFLVQQLFAFSLGFLMAVFNVFLRDLKEAVGVVVQLWFWVTPIVYTLDIVPESLQGVFLYNPALLFIRAYQNIFLYNTSPAFHHLMLLGGLSISLLILASYVFRKLEKDMRDFL
jgi:lipopolysaccharide transport system permease protein